MGVGEPIFRHLVIRHQPPLISIALPLTPFDRGRGEGEGGRGKIGESSTVSGTRYFSGHRGQVLGSSGSFPN